MEREIYWWEIRLLTLELKRLAGGSIIYGVGTTLQKFMGLLLLPFFTRVLTPSEYGIAALLSLIAVALGGLFNLGTGNSLGLLYYREEYTQHRPALIWTNASLMFCNSTLFIILLMVLSPWVSDLVFESQDKANLLRLSLLGLGFTTISAPFLAYLRMEEKAWRFVAMSLSSALLYIFISAMLVLWLRMGILGLILAGVISNGLMLLIVLLTIARQLPFRLEFSFIPKLVRIGFPSVFGLFAFMLIDYADRQMLQRMVGIEALGVYSVGYSFGMIMMVFVGAFSNAWPPFFQSFMNRLSDARRVFGKILKYYVLGFGLLVLVFFTAAKPVVSIMVASTFQEAYIVVGLVAAGYMLRGCYLILLPGLSFAHKLNIRSGIEWFAAIINLGLNLLWIPKYGIIGAAIATLVSNLCLPVLTWFFGRRFLSVDYEWGKIMIGTFLLTLGCIGIFVLSSEVSLFAATISSLFLVLFITYIVFIVCFDELERNIVRKTINGFLRI